MCIQKRNNNKEDVQHRIGGFHQDKFEMISQREGKAHEIKKNKLVDECR